MTITNKIEILDKEPNGCGKMYCAIIDDETGKVCGEIDNSHSAYCIKHGRSTHKICGDEGLCLDCEKRQEEKE